MYIVVLDHPFYPEVYYFTALGEAQAKVDELIKDHAVENAENEGKVTLAVVSRTIEIRTEY